MIQRLTTARQVVPTPHKIFPAATPSSKPVSSTDSPYNYTLNLLISTVSSGKAASELSGEMQTRSVQASGQEYIFLGATSHLASVLPILTRISQDALPTFVREPSARSSLASNMSPHQVISPDVSNASQLFAVFYRSSHI